MCYLKIHAFFNEPKMSLDSECLKTYTKYINLCFMTTIHEDKIISKYFDLGRGHLGYSHVTGVT